MGAERTAVALAVTMGDPRGIGPEIILKALARDDLPSHTGLLVIGCRAVLAAAAERMGMPFALPCVPGPAEQWESPALLDLDDFPAERLEPREPDALSGQAAIDYIERAVALALAGEVDGIVTAPISKEAIAAAGSPFPGHTEMLAELTGAPTPVMMLVSGRLRVALVTTHAALRDVPGLVTADGIAGIARVLDEGLRRFFGAAQPSIALCGLNPHCGDGGRFGDEEARVLIPAVAAAREQGIGLIGPEPADSVFVKAAAGTWDAMLALYHDQGMIPVKMGGLGAVVNVTLGLPIVRTSVAHGTAFDLAWQAKANPRSMIEAVRVAGRLVRSASAES